jgi:hypothetical protein
MSAATLALRSRYITGHASGDEGDKYGLGYSLPVLAAATAKFPSPVE